MSQLSEPNTGLNAFEFDSHTAPTKPSMSWSEACATIGPIVHQYARHRDNDSDKIHEAWAVILRGW
jgi:hypothetical protein